MDGSMFAEMNKVPVRMVPSMAEKVDRIESILMGMPQVECKTQHWFCNGMYVRECTFPKGVTATGAAHLADHVSIMVRGDMTVLTERGIERMTGYNIWTPRPGLRRVGYAHEETVWLTVDRTNAKTVEDAENDTLATPDKLLSRRQGSLEHDRADYLKVLEEAGIPVEVAEAEATETSNLISMPVGWRVHVSESKIHGSGLFTDCNVSSGKVVAPAMIGGKRTPAGRYVNHSSLPNAVIMRDGLDSVFVALRDIVIGEEITADYRSSLVSALHLEAA